MLSRNRLLTSYYLATPAFWLLDLLAHVPIRAAGLEQPGWRIAYYLFAFGCGLLCRWRPRVSPVVGMAESSVNILLLALSVLLPIFSLPGQLETGEPLYTGLTPLRLANFVLAACVLLFSFYSNQAALAEHVRRGGHA